MNWKTKHINLGEIAVGKKRIITFTCLEDLGIIKNMVSTCGCSTPKRKDNNIIVTFVPGPVPLHLASVKFYVTTKQIKITYADGTQDILSFTAKVIKN